MSATRSSWFNAAAAMLAAVAALSVSHQTVSAQSLADVAKKEEERRETIHAPAKVYTNKDLRPAPGGSPAPPATADDKDKDKDAAKSDADGKKTAAAAKEPVKDRAYWSGKLQGLQQALDRDQGYFTALQSRINALTTDAVNRDDPVQRMKLEQDRKNAIAELARLEKAINEDKKAIADLLEEARTAGVPPAWLR
jgi:hypothetical protein